MDTDSLPEGTSSVTIYGDTLDDLLAIAKLTRRDHRDVLRDAVEAIRERLMPKLQAPAQRAKRSPKAAS